MNIEFTNIHSKMNLTNTSCFLIRDKTFLCVPSLVYVDEGTGTKTDQAGNWWDGKNFLTSGNGQ